MQTMNYKEAARYLKITTGTLRNWVSTGRIKPHKVGRHVIFFKEELEAWITSPQSSPPTPAASPSSQLQQPIFLQKPLDSANSHKPQKGGSAPVPWNPQCNVTFSDKVKDPYALLLNLPDKNVKMTPENLRELARLLVDTATFCERPDCRGLTNFPIYRENKDYRSSVCVVPFYQISDLQTLALAALRAGDVTATTKEKYVVQFIRDGLRHQLPLINMQLTKRGMRRISFKSLRK
jgi:excisionase family DNA binding protein